jgi:hypothetical protein
VPAGHPGAFVVMVVSGVIAYSLKHLFHMAGYFYATPFVQQGAVGAN